MTAEMLEIPQVQGRHRNKVLAARRRTRAIELITAGHAYQQVADELGYANKGSAAMPIRAASTTSFTTP